MLEPLPVLALVVASGPSTGRTLPLDGEHQVLGREPGSDLWFEEGSLSRSHCEFTRDEAGWSVRDLGAKNGTRLNGRPLKEEAILLTAGDRLRAGSLEFELAEVRPGHDRLRVVAGPLAGRGLRLPGTLGALGRSTPDADVALDDHAASKRNTELAFADAVWWIKDLDSRNGTDLDGARLPPGLAVRLHSGARLRVGSSQLDFLDRRCEDRAGSTLLGCSIEERHACGPTSLIYRGRLDGRQVAVRVLDPNHGRPDAPARYLAAARNQARIEHPNLLRIHSADLDNGLPLLIADWLPGGCLATRLAASNTLSATVVLPWLRDAARGLAGAEAEDLAHLGLRPANLLFDSEGGVVVSDLLTATTWNRDEPHAAVPPHYLAPEQLDGGGDARAAQFALGCILHHALSGHAPFGSPDRSLIAEARRSETLPPIEDLPTDVARVLSRLLGRDPGDRYPSFVEVAADLDQLIRGSAPATSTLPPARTAYGAPSIGASSTRAVAAQPNAARASARGASPALEARPILSTPAAVAAIPPWALKGAFALLLLMVVVGFILPALNRANSPTTPTVVPAASPAPVTSLPPPVASVPAPEAAPEPPPIAVALRLVVQGRLAGPGRQHVNTIASDGTQVWATCGGTTVRLTLATSAVTSDGELGEETLRQPASGPFAVPPATFSTDTGALLRTPRLSTPGWTWWGWNQDTLATATATQPRGSATAETLALGLAALDTGGWAMVAWTEAGNSVLACDPRDPALANPVLGAVPPGAASALLLAAADGTPLAGCWFPDTLTTCVTAHGRWLMVGGSTQDTTLPVLTGGTGDRDDGFLAVFELP